MNYKIQSRLIKRVNKTDSNIDILTDVTNKFQSENYVKTSAEFIAICGENTDKAYGNEKYNQIINECMKFENLLFDVIRDAQKLISYKPHKEALENIKINSWFEYATDLELAKAFFKQSRSLTEDVINDVYSCNNDIISENKIKRCTENPYEQLKCIVEILVRKMKQVIKILNDHDLPLLFHSSI